MCPEEGTLLPLWQFTAARAKRRAVTALAWSPRYSDLFAVGYGSFDFLHPTTGLVACFSLKNPGHPEYCFPTAAGVMCLDFHPEHPALLAVGCYDGRVCIFDVRAGKLAGGRCWRRRWPAVRPVKPGCQARRCVKPAGRGALHAFDLLPSVCTSALPRRSRRQAAVRV